VIPYGMSVPVAVRRLANCYTPFTFTLPNLNPDCHLTLITPTHKNLVFKRRLKTELIILAYDR